MHVMNIIYACDDICDLCEYLRLLEKKKKFFAESKSHCSRRRGRPALCGVQSFAESRRHSSRRRAPFNESQIFGSRQRALLQRELDIWVSAKEWPPLLTEGRAVTVRGPSARAKDASRRMSAERI
jgi:hypothetical protein